MIQKDIGEEPANPCTSDHTNTRFSSRGLTKREFFAAMALQGIASQGSSGGTPQNIGEQAVYCADKLLAALAK
jgi:hypothetical protein